MDFQTPNPLLYQLREGSLADPYVDKVETLKPVDGRIVLSEIPVRQNGVLIDGHVEIDSNTPIGNQFYVDYSYGVVYFVFTKNTSVTTRYKGRGTISLPSDRVFYKKDTVYKSLDAHLSDVNISVENYRVQLSYMQNQINQMVISGDSSPEAAQARIGVDGTTYPTLKSRIDTEILQKPSGSPRGVYSTLSALQAEKPNGDNFTYVVSSDGRWYFWSGTSWSPGGIYQATQLTDKDVSPRTTTFIESSSNLLNKDDPNVQLNIYINALGSLVSSTGYFTSHKIYVINGETYSIRYAESAFGAFYKKDGTFISKIGTTSGTASPFTFTVPANAHYMLVCGQKAMLATDMIVAGNTYPSTYTPFYLKLKFDSNSKDVEVLKTTTTVQSSYFRDSANLFDKSDSGIVDDFYINALGQIVAASGLFITGKIPIKLNTSYTMPYESSLSNTIMGDYLDENGIRVARVESVQSGLNRIIITPSTSTIRYMKLNGVKSNKSTLMVVEGTTYPATYIEFQKLLSENFGLNDKQKAQALALVPTSATPLKNKIALFNGDSITAGAGWTSAPTKLAPRNNTGWGLIITQDNQMTGYGYGVGGGTIAANTFMSDGTTPRHWICRDISNMQTTADYIIFQGGINDYWLNVPLGTISTGYNATLDDTTFCGALESIFKQAQLKWKGKKIGFIITHKVFGTTNFLNPNMSELYWEKARFICKKWSIPYIDLFNESGLNYDLDDIRNQYSQPRADNTGGDGCHPTESAYRQFLSSKIEAWLKEF